MSKPSDRDEARESAASMLWAWGWYDLADQVRTGRTCSCRPKHTARPPHPDTQIGKGPR